MPEISSRPLVYMAPIHINGNSYTRLRMVVLTHIQALKGYDDNHAGILSRPRLFPLIALVMSVDLCSKLPLLHHVTQHIQTRIMAVPPLHR
jgi:hypothetical protein